MGFAVGSTVVGGIQDVSALLPLLGTGQCEDHIGSALENGYLYAAAASLSIFGSLGLVAAAFKAAAASICFPFRSKKVIGAEKLHDAGFSPVGKVISLICWDGNMKRHKAESQFISLLEEHHLRDVSKLTVESKTRSWNLQILLTSLIAVLISFTPYIYFVERSGNEPLFLRWIFPVARSLGSLITANMIQIIIQTRILEIVKHRLIFMGVDEVVKGDSVGLPDWWSPRRPSEEALYALEHHLTVNCRGDARRPTPQTIHVSLASPVGDVGEGNDEEPPLDLFTVDLEKQLVLLAVKDRLTLEVDRHLPSRTKLRSRVILFIAQIMILLGLFLSLVGYVGCFSLVQGSQTSVGPLIWLGCEVALSLLRVSIWSWNPKWDESTSMFLSLKLSPGRTLSTCINSTEDLDRAKSLPLTRAREFLNSVTSCVGLVAPFDGGTGAVYYTLSGSLKTGMKTLYATVYDYKENLARVITRRPSKNAETTIEFHVGYLNDDHDIATIGEKITEKEKDHFVAEHPDFFQQFEKHYHSILRDSSHDVSVPVKLSWEIQTTDGSQEGPVAHEEISEHDRQYVSVWRMEKAKAELSEKRAKWIGEFMEVVTDEERIGLQEGAEGKDLVDTLESAATEVLLLHEWLEMEKLLMDGSRQVETILSERNECLQSYLSRDRHDESLATRLEGEQKKGTASRFAAEAKAMEERLKKRGDEIRKRTGEAKYKALKEIDLEKELSEMEKSIKGAWKDLLEGAEPKWRATCIATDDDPLRLLLGAMDDEIVGAKIENRAEFEDAMERTREREARMKERLGAEKRKLDPRIERMKRPANAEGGTDVDLEADKVFVDACEGFRSSGQLAWHSVGKAFIIFDDAVSEVGILAVREALEENTFVTAINCGDCSAENVIHIIRALKKAKNISLTVSDKAVVEFHGPASQRLSDALLLHNNVVSLGRPLDALPACADVIERNRHLGCDDLPLIFYERVEANGGQIPFLTSASSTLR